MSSKQFVEMLEGDSADTYANHFDVGPSGARSEDPHRRRRKFVAAPIDTCIKNSPK